MAKLAAELRARSKVAVTATEGVDQGQRRRRDSDDRAHEEPVVMASVTNGI